MKEDRIKAMSKKEIKNLKSMVNKEQVKHSIGLAEQSSQDQ